MSEIPAELLFSGGTVYTPAGPVVADLRVSNGVIAGLEEPGTRDRGATVVEASGLLLLPGAIDVHVHGRDPGSAADETFESLTSAAAVGGVTTVLDMPNTIPGVDSRQALQAKRDAVLPRARVDFGLWGLVRASTTASDIEELANGGAIGLKAYLGYSWDPVARRVLYEPAGQGLEPPPEYGTLARLAPALIKSGLTLGVHAEDASVLLAFERTLNTYQALMAARPALAEAVAVAALGAVSRHTGLAFHVCHLSSAAGLAEALAARRAGATLSLETCPHYLWLTDADYERVGPRLKGYPLVRTASDREALREGLRRGDVDVVATDHAPHREDDKQGSLAEVAPGNPGVQTLLVSCLELARAEGGLAEAVRWVSGRPASLFGLTGRKGAIQAGADADLVLVDPAGRTVVDPSGSWSRQRRGALDGLQFGFEVKATYLRGRLVAEGGRPVGEPAGRQVTPARPA